jgi:Family of unknown function (DUF5677)
MNDLPVLSQQMFLGSEVSAYVEHVNQTHRTCLSFAKRLNEVAHRSLLNTRLNRTNLQQVLLLALVQRGLKAFQASILLFERGLPEEGQVALRTLLEITFKTVAVAKDKEVAIAFAVEDHAHRRKFINKYALLSTKVQDPQVIQEMAAMLIDCKADIGKSGAKELGTYWFAEKANLLDFYNTAYAALSSTAHANVRTLETALDLNQNGEIRGLTYGFSDEGITDNVYTACESLLFTLHAGFSMGDIPEQEATAIKAAHVEFTALYAGLL